MQMAIGQCEGYIWFTAIYRSNKPWANTHDFIPAMSISFSLFTVRIFQTDSPSYPPPHLRHLAKSLPVPKGITPTLGWCVKGFRSATQQVNSLEMIWSDVELTLNSTFSGTIMGDVAIDQYALMQTKGAVSSINVFFSLTVLHCFQFCL